MLLWLSSEILSRLGWTQEEDCTIVLFTSYSNPVTISAQGFDIHALGICLEGDSIHRYLYLQKLQLHQHYSNSKWLDDKSIVFYALEGPNLLPVGTPFTVSHESYYVFLGICKDGEECINVGLDLQSKDTAHTSDEVLLNCLITKKDDQPAKRKRVTLGEVQYGSIRLKSREANRAAMLWIEKYANDVVSIDRMEGRAQLLYRVYVPTKSKWKRVRTLSECVSHAMEQCDRDFWDDMLTSPGCIDLY